MRSNGPEMGSRPDSSGAALYWTPSASKSALFVDIQPEQSTRSVTGSGSKLTPQIH
jgi:hypothetical protein